MVFQIMNESLCNIEGWRHPQIMCLGMALPFRNPEIIGLLLARWGYVIAIDIEGVVTDQYKCKLKLL